MVPYRDLNGTHRFTEQCKQGAERKRRRLSAEEERDATARALSAYGRPPGDGDLLQIPETGDLIGRLKLADGGKELVPGKVGMEEDDANPQQGGGSAAGVWLLF